MVREKWWGMARGQGPVSRSSTQQHGALAGGTGGTGGTGEPNEQELLGFSPVDASVLSPSASNVIV